MQRWMTVAIVGSLLVVRTASADMTFDQKKKQADALVEEGRALAKKKDFVAAREKFMQAYAVLPVPNMVYNAARMDHLRGEYAEAYRGYKTFLALPDSDRVSAADRKEVEAFVAEIDSKVCHLEVHGTRTFLVDGKTLTEPLVLSAGTHTVKMDGDSGPKSTDVPCRGGGAIVAIEYVLKPVVLPPPPKVVPIAPPPQEKTERGSWLVPAVLAGVGVVGVGVGIGLGVVTASKDSDLRTAAATSPCDARGGGCAAQEDDFSSAKGTRSGFIVAYAVGGVALAGSLISALVLRPWELRAKGTASVGLLPIFSNGMGGLSAQGSF